MILFIAAFVKKKTQISCAARKILKKFSPAALIFALCEKKTSGGFAQHVEKNPAGRRRPTRI